MSGLIGVLPILAVPITRLGFVSPYASRLRMTDVGHAGNAYALGGCGRVMSR